LTRYLQARDQVVTEAGRPPRASKRPGGKSDPADAARAARDALAAGKLAQPRADGAREALRILLAARCQATTARTAAVNTFKDLILGAPDRLRQQLRGLSMPRQTARCRALRVHASQPVAEQVLHAELRRLATHIRAWDQELRASKAQLHQLVAQVMPVLLDQPGVGPMSAAQLLVSGRTQAGADPKPPSPPSPESARYPHPQARSPGSGSTPSATGSSTAPCTSSSAGGCSTTARPRPTSPAGPATKPIAKSAAASSATRPRPLPPHGDSRKDLTAHRSVSWRATPPRMSRGRTIPRGQPGGCVPSALSSGRRVVGRVVGSAGENFSTFSRARGARRAGLPR